MPARASVPPGRARVATSLLFAALLAGPAFAPAAAGDAPPVDETTVQRFLAAWAPRVLDEAWMQAYFAAPGWTPDLETEGFHALDEAAQWYLVQRLYDHLVATSPAFRAEVEARPAEQRGQDRVDSARALHMAIFGKDRLRELFERPDALPPQDPASETAVGEAGIRAGLLDAVERLGTLRPSLDTALAPPVPPTPQLDLVTLAPANPATVALADQRGFLHLANDGLAELPPLPPRPGGVEPDGGAPADVQRLVQAVTYAGCVFDAAGIVHCTAWLPLGVPHLFDATRDGIPDLVADVAPAPDPLQPLGSYTLRALLQRLNPAGPLQAGVALAFSLPFTDKLVWAIVDGRDTSLATHTQVQLTVKNPAELALGRVNVFFGISHTWAPNLEQPSHVGLLLQWLAFEGLSSRVLPDRAVLATFHFQPLSSWATNVDIDIPARRAEWSACCALQGLDVLGYMPIEGRPWVALALMAGVPDTFVVQFDRDRAYYDSAAPLGSILAAGSNDGTLGYYGFPHARVDKADDTGDFRFSFLAYDVKRVDVERTDDGGRADVRMNAGQPLFFVQAVAATSTELRRIDSWAFRVPGSLQLSYVGEDFTYDADANFDLVAYGEFGNRGGIAAAPPPPAWHGASLTDGLGCVGDVCGVGKKLWVFLTGFPTHADVDLGARDIDVRGFLPAVDTIVVQVDLEQRARSIHLLAILGGFSTTQPNDLHFGPVETRRLADGTHLTTANATANHRLGPLTVFLTRGGAATSFYVSDIPASMALSASVGRGTSTVRSVLSQPIGEILLGVSRAGAAVSEAVVHLKQVPADVALSFGRVTVADADGAVFTAPGFSYQASASTLDLGAFVDATFADGDGRARISMAIEDLGKSMSATLSGHDLRFLSSPATKRFEVHLWAEYSVMKTFRECLPSSCPSWRLEFGGHAGLAPVKVDDLVFLLTDFTDVPVEFGLTTGVFGQGFGTFVFAWNGGSFTIDFEARLRICVFGCSTVAEITWHDTLPITVEFHVATNHSYEWQDIGPESCEIEIHVLPHPHGKSRNGFGLGGQFAEGGAHFITPDPYDIVHDDLITIIAAHEVGGVDFEEDC